MTKNVFSRRTALRGLLTGAAVSAAPRVLGVQADRFTATRTTASRTRPTVWLSGAGDDRPANIANGGFADWRGDPTHYARIWADTSISQMTGVYMLDPYKSAGWAGTLDIACGGPRDGHTWATAATGSMDDVWRATCRKVFAQWGKLSGVHLSMSHELNGNWYPWSVDKDSAPSFKKAWARWYGIVGEELVAKGKNAKVCLSLNSDTVKGVDLLSLIPDVKYFNIVGVDFYSMYPDLTTQALWDANRLTKKSDGAPRGIQAWFDYARSIGKPISFPEWGLSTQSKSDNPFFIEQMRNIFAANGCGTATLPGPGEVAGESYFNATSTKCRLWPTTDAPKSAAKYQSLSFGH